MLKLFSKLAKHSSFLCMCRKAGDHPLFYDYPLYYSGNTKGIEI